MWPLFHLQSITETKLLLDRLPGDKFFKEGIYLRSTLIGSHQLIENISIKNDWCKNNLPLINRSWDGPFPHSFDVFLSTTGKSLDETNKVDVGKPNYNSIWPGADVTLAYIKRNADAKLNPLQSDFSDALLWPGILFREESEVIVVCCQHVLFLIC